MISKTPGMLRTLFVVVSSLVLAAAAQAGTIAYGPTPYVNATPPDTPAGFFDLSHPSCVGFIEDFEDNSIDPFLTFSDGEILPPFSFSGDAKSVTDSVDGDDGSVDGDGNAGYSYFIANATEVTISFADTVHAAGLVFTDGDRVSTNIILEAYDPMGNLLDTIDAGDLADDVFTGTTAEDRFLGFTDDMTGIGSIRLVMVGGDGIEIDHVHWQTECVPEPTSGLMAIFAVLGLVGLRRRR